MEKDTSFIKTFIERETVSRRHFLLASAAGVAGLSAMGLGLPALAAPGQRLPLAWSYRDRSNPYWNELVSGGELKGCRPFREITYHVNEGIVARFHEGDGSLEIFVHG